MGIEAANFISELVATNPVGSVDDYATADDHLRLIKSVLQSQFPNFAAAAVNPTDVELNLLVGLLASSAELNTLDGYLGNTADLNVLSGAAAGGLTAAELLFVADVTSAIQAQLNGKAPTAHSHTGAEISDLDAADTTTGVFVEARIPNLPATRITSLAFADARIAESNVTQHVAAINHDLLLGFLTNEHIDHTGVSVLAGTGMSGGGTIAATRTLDADVASETVRGMTETATQVEVDAGVDSLRYVTPAALKASPFGEETGSFTATLTGFGVNPTGSVKFTRHGDLVMMYVGGSAILGTSDATTMTMTGLPASITPASPRIVAAPFVRDNAVDVPCDVQVTASSTISFFVGDPRSNSVFTASGSKGLSSSWGILYNL